MEQLFADVGFASLLKHGEELCGDKVHITRTEESTVVVLADGLGSGVKANILATLTSKIAGDMLRMGADIEDVVDTITGTLPVCKVRGVAYSTFTLFQMFPDGQVYIVEYDNPSTFYFHNGRLAQLKTNERIVNGKLIKESRFHAAEDDTLVMVSDGAVHAGVGGILNLGWQWEHIADFLQRVVPFASTPEEVAGQLADACNELYCSKPGDDTTVVSVKFRRPTPVALFVGPPRNQQDDEAMVREWFKQPGKKVICGGTSANIAARLLNLSIDVDQEGAVNPEVPPIARMKGIDLVTEGVLTLRKVLEYLNDFAAGGLDQSALEEPDGASRLARLLIREATQIGFYVGTAINPAHQNPNFPQDLNIKLRIVKEMNRVLQSIGKQTMLTLY